MITRSYIYSCFQHVIIPDETMEPVITWTKLLPATVFIDSKERYLL